MRPFLAGLGFLLASTALPVAAEDATWIQIAARSSLTKAQEEAENYQQNRQNVSGFALGSGWYGIALGPYDRKDAEQLLRKLLGERAIPGDSYLVSGNSYRERFWPLGAPSDVGPNRPLPGTQAAPVTAPVDQPQPAEPTPEPQVAPEPAPQVEAAAPAPAEPEIKPADETVQEARASEKALDREQKRYLQVALKWAGHYNGAIDGLYGRGTRASMQSWQVANQHEPTGVLTTAQRAELVAAYEAILEGMDLQPVQDDAAAIRMKLPLGVVDFARYDPPFVRFEPNGDLNARVLMISQQGNAETMAGLYEIMQTLEIVPPEGPRKLTRTGFTLEGQNDRLHSYTEVSLKDGALKGFTLVWPAGDEARRTRVLEQMQSSFVTLDGALDPAISTPGDDQQADLVSGLEIRKPLRSRTGVFLDGKGRVLTSAEAVQDCGHIDIDGAHDAVIELADTTRNIAVLKPETTLAPRATAVFQSGVPRLKSQVALAGFPYGGVLTSAAMTFGTLEDLRGLDGDDSLNRLALSHRDSEIGGPVFDNSGRVIGVLMPPEGDKKLTGAVSFVRDAQSILEALSGAGVKAEASDGLAYVTDEVLTETATKMTVLVRCWE